MKALVATSGKSYGVIETSKPQIKEDEVLVQVEYVAICASDFDVLYGYNEEEVVYPIIPGHEWSGKVAQAGKNFTHLVGKKVTGDNAIGCGECPACKKGKVHICVSKKELGFSLNGAYAEFMVVPGENIIELGDNIDIRQTSLAEPLAVCLHSLKISNVSKDHKVLVIGDGPIGLLTVILAGHLGVKEIMIAGHHQGRLDLAQTWTGAKTANTHDVKLIDVVDKEFGQKADVVFETTGRSAVVSESLTVLERGGTLCLVGCYLENIELNPYDLVLYEQLMVGSVSYYRKEMQEVLQMLGQGLLDGKDIITHEFDLSDYQKAFDVVEKRKDNVIKACFKM